MADLVEHICSTALCMKSCHEHVQQLLFPTVRIPTSALTRSRAMAPKNRNGNIFLRCFVMFHVSYNFYLMFNSNFIKLKFFIQFQTCS